MDPTYQDALRELVIADPEIVVLTAENRSPMRSLPPLLGPKFIDVGICEQTMIGAAAGLALRGRTPIVHALATFLVMRAYEFIRTDVGIGKLPVKLIGAVPGFLSDANGPTHQAIEDVALMRGIPGMQVFCPSDQTELARALPTIVKSRAPTYVRYNPHPPAVEHRTRFEIGKAEVFGDGAEVAILVYGLLLKEALSAMAELEKRGIRARVVDVRMPKPIDEEAVIEAARSTRLLVTLEDHFETGGLFSIVGEVFLRRGVQQKVLPIALPERWFRPALLDQVLRYEGFTGPQIAERIAAAR
jgi:transketolase